MNTSTNLNYSLTNSNNYKINISSTSNDIIKKYNLLVIEYLNFIIENINIKNSTYSKFIITRGLVTITHVFTILLFYSRNLDMSYYHSQKSFYFYVEFIEQISNDEHTFLKLSSRDASMFVYRKTIFEINNENRKNTTKLSCEDLIKIKLLNSNIHILNNIIYFTVKDINFLDNNCFDKAIQRIENIINNLLKFKINEQFFDLIQIFTDSMNKDNIHIDKYYDIIIEFLKKLSIIKYGTKNKLYEIIESKIKNKFNDLLCDSKIEENPVIFIKWIFD